VSARGVRVKVASANGPASYSLASGTSFSCPLVAGVVALLLQAHPAYTVDDVILALRSTASQAAGPDNLLGWGIADAVRAVDVALPVTRTNGTPNRDARCAPRLHVSARYAQLCPP
jgi:serine protease AprX